MHVILLGTVWETLDLCRDGITCIEDIDIIVDDIAGVRHPLPAHHELIVHAVAEGIGHATMMPAEPRTRLDGPAQISRFVLFDFGHGENRHDEIEARKLALVWGTHCVQVPDAQSIDEMFSNAGEVTTREGFTKPGDRILITAGVPIGTPGTSNMLRIATIGRDGKGI